MLTRRGGVATGGGGELGAFSLSPAASGPANPSELDDRDVAKTRESTEYVPVVTPPSSKRSKTAETDGLRICEGKFESNAMY